MAHRIGCLETRWSARANDERSIRPILQVIEANCGICHIYRTCATIEDFRHHLKGFKKLASCKIIYIAAHGSPFTLHLAGKHTVSIDELEEQMKSGFEGRLLHLGACRSVLSRSQTRWKAFMQTTGIVAVSGFSTNVEWVESSAVEMLWFAHLQKYVYLSGAINTFSKHYPDLCKRNNFQIFKQ